MKWIKIDKTIIRIKEYLIDFLKKLPFFIFHKFGIRFTFNSVLYKILSFFPFV